MPLSTIELNRLANSIGASTLTIRLHTAAPSDNNPTNGRINIGGGTYESGYALTAGNISNSVNGDINNSVAIAFGTADDDIGIIRYWSAYRGNAFVAWGTIPNTTVNNGDTFTINSGSMNFNGSTS